MIPCNLHQAAVEDRLNECDALAPVLVVLQISPQSLHNVQVADELNKRLNKVGYYFHIEINVELDTDEWKFICGDYWHINPGV